MTDDSELGKQSKKLRDALDGLLEKAKHIWGEIVEKNERIAGIGYTPKIKRDERLIQLYSDLQELQKQYQEVEESFEETLKEIERL